MHSANIVRVERDGELALVIAHNPPVNTITAEVRTGLRAALQQIHGTSDTAAVVLLCEGNTFFSGADIGELSGPPKEEEYRAMFGPMHWQPAPLLAQLVDRGLSIAQWQAQREGSHDEGQ